MTEPEPEAARIARLVAAQRAYHATVRRTGASERARKLGRLRDAIRAREPAIRDALYADFRKAPLEVDVTEIFASLVEIKDAMRSVGAWMQPGAVPTPLALAGTQSWIHYEPRGVALIIGPWNYPFQLCIAPLVGAIAAGCCAIVKPSELTPHTSAVLAALIGSVFDEREIAVVEGGVATSTALLDQPFDHIFFTGSTRVGRIVAAAAAKHLASTTLELGGKSPAVVDDSADLPTTARRLAWGKFVNAGQTCIAPDYVLVSEGKRDALVAELGRAIAAMYGATAAERQRSPDLCRIIDDKNFQRLDGLLAGTLARGARAAIGGERDAAERYIAPTVLVDVPPDAPVMGEEIFGPILPVLTYRSFAEVAPFITARDKPLALYVFGEEPARITALVRDTTAGGTCINNTVLHFANPNLPFGGVGASGTGSYHGYHGFRAFTHARGVLKQGRIDMLRRVYPPYTPSVKRLLGWMSKLFT